MSSDTKEYRFVDTVPGELLGGRPIAPGEYVQLSEEDLEEQHIVDLVDQGKLIPGPEAVQPKATDAATKAAKKEGIELTAITPTGADGQITVDDVERYAAEQKEEQS